MSSEIAISVKAVSKHHLMFDRPEDRLRQMVVPRLQRLVGRAPKRYYRDFAALTEVSLEVRRGETVGIVGRNGSGKSTLLQIICGTLQPTSGSVTVNGRVAALLELGAGFNPDFTGRENAYLNASILGLSSAEMDKRFGSIAAFADIGDFIEQPVKTYSSGMYVRLAFAVAINVDPDILVVDEALAVGDEAFSRKCFARIEQIKERGGTILFVSHAAQTIVQLCDRAVLLDAGEVIMIGRPKTVTSQYQRLVNASLEMGKEIRNGIVELNTTFLESQRSDVDSGEKNASISHVKSAEGGSSNEACSMLSSSESATVDSVVVSSKVESETNGVIAQDADYYDLNLSSKSTIYLEERGARIRDMSVLTLGGEKINVLQAGKRYVFEYMVDFTSEAMDVGFEFLFKSVTGLVIAGTDTHKVKRERIPLVSVGSSLKISFTFSCLMLPGSYLVSAGVRGSVDGDFRMLHKIVEGALIRVANEPELAAIGCVNLDATSQVLLSPAIPPKHSAFQ
ncbi:ABC transporter ATP-binding protein [Mesorhizobium sp. WSM4898]|uniref:ABC transporter ATP-binding protein n=1 Tax=Mesorhizobium sp. WSM4898 TaxID=3038544 RepID=UPI0024159197|nr:ABC transporter ATP-binding protein [Mesorhizobium sp. WSM4898]MDG4908804.1 ABC transporter ATP-binding protein [Mesorhizobium sp. WSM4898]WIE90872.1 ABC transporter ATP-binding protein [Mesorhizobium sp. WSM4875]